MCGQDTWRLCGIEPQSTCASSSIPAKRVASMPNFHLKTFSIGSPVRIRVSLCSKRRQGVSNAGGHEKRRKRMGVAVNSTVNTIENGKATVFGGPNPLILLNEPWRNRTSNLLIKSFFQDVDFIESNSLRGKVFRKFPDFARLFSATNRQHIPVLAARSSHEPRPVRQHRDCHLCQPAVYSQILTRS
jgi:hypothetical protein